MNSAPSDNLRAVQHTRELERVLQLPRRVWDEKQAEAFALELSERLRKPGGRMTLMPIQALALYEACVAQGLFAPIRVGGGKTLISLLLAFVLGARRPLLLTRANLIEKTKREARKLSEHWPIPNFIRIESYEKLGRAGHADMLELYAPDAIFGDEIHCCRNPKAAVTKRISRYMGKQKPKPFFAAMSGTITRNSILDFWHILEWCFGPLGMPLPSTYTEIEDWAAVIDKESDTTQPVAPGALIYLCNESERKNPDLVDASRTAFARRLTETCGVVATSERYLGASLTISAIETDMNRAVDEAFQELRTKWKTPDGWPLPDPMAVNRVLKEIGVGFYYIWDPRPPPEWALARRTWNITCQYILTNNRRNLDSELQVINAVDAGHYPEAQVDLAAWRLQEPTFTPNKVPVWIDDSVIDLAASWTMKHTGIVWCYHVAFAERLAKKTGLSYYHGGGLDDRGRYIEDHPQDEPLIASVASNRDGKNLQKWHRNLSVSCSASGEKWEQKLGRTHRDGQKAHEVVFDVVLTCLEQATAFDRARKEAVWAETQIGPQRLNYADVLYPSPEELTLRMGPRWRKK
jgi:hypothetical protein